VKKRERFGVQVASAKVERHLGRSYVAEQSAAFVIPSGVDTDADKRIEGLTAANFVEAAREQWVGHNPMDRHNVGADLFGP
jgi:hypothetical protein